MLYKNNKTNKMINKIKNMNMELKITLGMIISILILFTVFSINTVEANSYKIKITEKVNEYDNAKDNVQKLEIYTNLTNDYNNYKNNLKWYNNFGNMSDVNNKYLESLNKINNDFTVYYNKILTENTPVNLNKENKKNLNVKIKNLENLNDDLSADKILNADIKKELTNKTQDTLNSLKNKVKAIEKEEKEAEEKRKAELAAEEKRKAELAASQQQQAQQNNNYSNGNNSSNSNESSTQKPKTNSGNTQKEYVVSWYRYDYEENGEKGSITCYTYNTGRNSCNDY